MCKCKEISAPFVKSKLHNKEEEKRAYYFDLYIYNKKSIKSILAFLKKKEDMDKFDFSLIKCCRNTT